MRLPAAERHRLVPFHVQPAWRSTTAGQKQRMHVRRTGQRALVHTPAKINLFLEVLARRDDGFHEIETLMAAVSIFDTIPFEPHGRESIAFHCRWAVGIEARARGLRQSSSDVTTAVPAGPENLAWRAIELLRQRAGERRGAKVMLLKRIPAAAGLGGASSDAAAALVAANLGWELNWPIARLESFAAELGSDVRFFLTNGAAL